MATKTSAFIKLLASYFRDKANAGVPTTWQLLLLNDTVGDAYALVFADVAPLECSFKGYARGDATAAVYGLPTEPVTGKWQVKTGPIHFAYDSGAGSGLTSEDAKAWALIHSEGGSEKLMEAKNLVTPVTFASDVDELNLEHFLNSLNCDE